ncbi:MAG TPA: aminotransferase class III-fold pyridoxal phosphate-dependent enzyme, partial [Candidatus Limnocylindrales bacterium]|nr:aminotransferase class III-fold pyridoxal phosphate-dependent enzyme [Candidatus Limnocylindrales bacterium]
AVGAVPIADEVQVGFGRVGSAVWAFEAQGARPDIVTMGKPIGNGHPLGAVVTTRAIADAFNNGMEYFNTFGGNPVSAAIGLAVLDVIADEGLQEHARFTGERLLAGLREVAARHEPIGEVRGMGLFVGFELVRDRATREPDAALATELVNRAAERGVLLSTDGPDHDVIKIKPPMVFSAADADRLVETVDTVLTEVGSS